MGKLLSTDIFDTVLTRSLGDPHDLFDLVGDRLVVARLLTDELIFRGNRIEAERRRRQGMPNGEVTLAEIYERLAPAFGWDESASQRAQEIELQAEADVLCPVPGAAERLAAHRREGGRIAFVSDTYLPESFIREALDRFGLWQPEDRLLVSCEVRKSKASHTIWSEFDPDDRPGGHIGNSLEHDVGSAQQAGLEAEWFPQGNLTRYERRLTDARRLGAFGSRLAAASRLARLEHAGDAAFARSITGVVAPTLILFVGWVLESAAAKGCRRIHFLSRDGHFLFLLAQRLQARSRFEGSLHYLHGGRKVWYLARSRAVDDFLLNFLLDAPDGLTLRMVASRSGLTETLLREACDTPPDQPLSEDQRETLRSALGQGKLREALLEICQKQRQDLVAYLRQEGFGGGEPAALVDVGWTGKSLRCFQEILADVSFDDPLSVFYFGRLPSATQHDDQSVDAFLFDENLGPRYRPGLLKALDYTRIIENFCVSDQEPLDGFESKANGRVVPVFRGQRNQAAIDWGLTAMRNLVFRVAELLPEKLEASDHLAAAKGVDDLLVDFFQHPEHDEAEVWASFPIETDATGSFQRPWARAFGMSDLIHILRHGYLRQDSTHWAEASDCLTPPSLRRALAAATRLRMAAARKLRRQSVS